MGTKSKSKKVFTKNDYVSGDGMLTSVWGPSLWHFLHSMSFNYPDNPTTDDKKYYKNFLLGLEHILPCKYCRTNLKKNLEKLPLTDKNMKNRESFSRYIFNLHELVNKMLKKKSGLTYCEVRERYEHFRSRCTLDVPESSFSVIKMKKTRRNKKQKEKGCTEPLYGQKAKCLIRIVPDKKKAKTLTIDKKCLKSKTKSTTKKCFAR
jgi:hypothetical protein